MDFFFFVSLKLALPPFVTVHVDSQIFECLYSWKFIYHSEFWINRLQPVSLQH